MRDMHEPLVSIAMPVFNGAKTLRVALRSLEFQTFQNWELLLIDDGSSDQTPAILREAGDRRIRVFVDGNRRGHGPRLNQAIDLATGKYIARMDQDDISFPERLAMQVKFMEEHPQIDLLGTRALVFQDDGAVKGFFPFRQTHAEICRRPAGGFYLAHPTWMGRVEWFRKFRYLENEVLRAEDQDLLLRSHRTSTFACMEEVMLGYRQNQLPMKSVWTGRRSFCRAVIREALRSGRYCDIPVVLVEQFMKGVYEQMASFLGSGSVLLRHRARSGDDVRVLARWQEIWQQCHESEGEKTSVA